MAIDLGFDQGAAAFTNGAGVPGAGPVDTGPDIGAIGGIIGGVGGFETVFGDGSQRGEGNAQIDLGSRPEIDFGGIGGTSPGFVPRPITITPSLPVIGVPGCPPGTTDAGGCRPCPPNLVCAAVCLPNCVPISGGAPAPGDGGVRPPTQIINDLLRGILGPGGGAGRTPTLGAAGTRLVAAQPGRSPVLTIVILAAAAGIGYYLWRRSRKGAS